MNEEKPDILKDYTFIKDIGEGNFGKVKLSILNATNEKYAIKVLNKEKLKTQTKSSLYNEIEIISKLKHPNIIHVEKILDDQENYYIIMEYCDNGELFEYIVNKERLSQEEASILFYQLINGVEYIHKQNFAHRDLKPENLLLTKNYKLKIIDFGLCHDFNGTKLLKSKCGSPSYAAPEILKGYPYDGFKTDIWCCGIILYGMLCGFLPFDGDDNQEIFKEIVQCDPEYPSFLEDDSIDLLIGILNPNPKNRLSIKKIKKHPFYLKGKNYYILKYDDIEEEEKNNNIRNNLGNYNSAEKKKCVFSSIRKIKGDIDPHNNIKTLKTNKDKNFKYNIYQNIFANIEFDEESNSTEKDKFKKLLNDLDNKSNKQSDKESEKYDKTRKRKINDIAEQSIKKFKKMTETEANTGSFLLRNFKSKFHNKNKLILDSNKLHFCNNDSLNKRLKETNYNNNINDFIINKNKLNENILNKRNVDKNQNNKIFTLKDMKLTNYDKNNIRNNFKENYNNIKDPKIKTESLDFFQRFLMNKMKNKKPGENIEKSPIKNNKINFNLILTKTKEKNKNEEDINNYNKRIKEKLLSEKKNKLYIKDNILYTQKRNKCDSAKKKFILHSQINLVSSPDSNNNYYDNKFDKFFDIIYGVNNKDECRSCSIRKRQRNKKTNKKLNLKIINLDSKENTIKKEKRNIFVKNYSNNKNENDQLSEMIMNKKNINLKTVFKTEPKYNQFLDKVIQKINSNKDKKIYNNKNINLLTLNNKFKNEDNKQVFKLLNFEKNNKESQGCPYLINYYKNNSIDEKNSKKSPIHFKEDKRFLLSLNPRIIENNKDVKDKMKKIFPNLAIKKYNS